MINLFCVQKLQGLKFLHRAKLDKIDKFLESQSLPKLNHEGIKSLKRFITSKEI